MHEFTIEENDGTENSPPTSHTYKCSPHPPVERGDHVGGLRLVGHVIDAAGRPLARLLESNAADLIDSVRDAAAEQMEADAEEGDGEPEAGADAESMMSAEMDDVIEQFEDIEWDLVSGFDDFMQVIQDADPEWLLPELMRHTSRDGKPLSNTEHFNAAYAGNYTELLRAAWEVVRINGFFGSLTSRLDDIDTDE